MVRKLLRGGHLGSDDHWASFVCAGDSAFWRSFSTILTLDLSFTFHSTDLVRDDDHRTGSLFSYGHLAATAAKSAAVGSREQVRTSAG